MAPTGETRARAFATFCRYLPYADALDLEHACYVVASINSSPYSRPTLRALYALQKSPAFARFILEDGAMKALSRKDIELFEEDPALVAAAAREHELSMYKSLLTDLSENDIQLSLDAGVRCGKCKSTDVSFTFLQTRSADESTTCFSTCSKCGKRWKLG